MKKAKEELGANAVVLNIKFLKARGLFRIFKKDQVEITAALEEKEFIKNVNTRKPEMKTVDPKKSNDNASLDLRADEDIDLNDPKRIEERLDALQKLMKESSANNQKLRQDNRFDSKNRKSEI